MCHLSEPEEERLGASLETVWRGLQALIDDRPTTAEALRFPVRCGARPPTRILFSARWWPFLKVCQMSFTTTVLSRQNVALDSGRMQRWVSCEICWEMSCENIQTSHLTIVSPAFTFGGAARMQRRRNG